MTEPDLFVVCKNCSAEVSPYVTECPYCGQRVRKRAPKIEREGPPEEERRERRRPRAPRLPRLKRGEIPGIAPETRPYATGGIVAVCLLVMIAGRIAPLDIGLVADPGDQLWRLAVTPLVHDNLGYLFIAMLATGIFGLHLERRFGPAAPVLIFLVAGIAGAALSFALGAYPALGANGAALGLLVAWLVDDRRAAQRGDERDNDLLGVYVIAAALALVALADPTASFVAAAGGAVTGALAGVALGLTRR